MIEKIVLAVVLSLAIYATIGDRRQTRSITNAQNLGRGELVAIAVDIAE